MEIEVTVHAENPLTSERKLTTTAFVTMVSVTADGRPQRVPALQATDDGQRRRAAEATERRRRRLDARSD